MLEDMDVNEELDDEVQRGQMFKDEDYFAAFRTATVANQTDEQVSSTHDTHQPQRKVRRVQLMVDDGAGVGFGLDVPGTAE